MPKFSAMSVTTLATAVILLASLLSLYTKFLFGGDFFYTLWSDRDLYRSFFLLDEFQFSGAESNFGGRVPGGALYYLTWILQQVDPEPEFVRRALVLLQGLGAVLLFFAARTIVPPLASLFAAGAFFAFPIHYDTINSVWNPAYVTIFVCAAYFFLLQASAKRSWRPMPYLILASCFGAQFHFSVLILLPLSIAILLRHRIGPTLAQGALSILALFVPLSLYLWWDLSNDFQNLQSLFGYQDLIGDAENPSLASTITYLGSFTTTLQFLTGFRDYEIGDNTVSNIKQVVALSAMATPFVLAIIGTVGRPGSVQSASPHGSPRLALDMLFVLAALPVIYTTFGIPTTARYLYPSLPALFILAAFGFDKIIDQDRRSARVLPKLLIPALACAPMLVAVDFYRNWPSSIAPTEESYTYDHYRALAAFSVQQLGASPQDAGERLAPLTVGSDGKAHRPGKLVAAFSYPVVLAARDGASVDGGHYPDACALALRSSSDNPLAKEAGLLTLKSFTDITGETSVLGHAEDRKFSYIIYRPETGNCVRSLNNKYVVTDRERRLEEALSDRTYGVHDLSIDDAKRVYGIKLKGMSDTAIGVEIIKNSTGDISFTVFSNALRGYTGVIDAKMQDGRLSLTGCGHPVDLPFPLKGTSTETTAWPPFQLNTLLDDACIYELSFHAENFVSELLPLGDLSLVLDQKFRPADLRTNQ